MTRPFDVLRDPERCGAIVDAIWVVGVEPTITDAVLDRIAHNAYLIDLKDESQRKRNKPPPLDGGNDK